MKHIHDINRSRPFKLINLLPEEVTKNEPPAFFIPTQNMNQKLQTTNLNKYEVFLHDKVKRVFKKAGHATTVITHLGKNVIFCFSLIFFFKWPAINCLPKILCHQ